MYFSKIHINAALKKNKVQKAKTLILDLDETLIHSCSLKENPMHVLKTVGEFGEEIPVYKRIISINL